MTLKILNPRGIAPTPPAKAGTPTLSSGGEGAAAVIYSAVVRWLLEFRPLEFRLQAAVGCRRSEREETSAG